MSKIDNFKMMDYLFHMSLKRTSPDVQRRIEDAKKELIKELSREHHYLVCYRYEADTLLEVEFLKVEGESDVRKHLDHQGFIDTSVWDIEFVSKEQYELIKSEYKYTPIL